MRSKSSYMYYLKQELNMNIKNTIQLDTISNQECMTEPSALIRLSCGSGLKPLFWKLPVIALTIFLGYGCTNSSEIKEASLEGQLQPIRVIFETDMGNDIDDALALDMLYKYADQGKVELLAINSNKDNDYSLCYIDILNTWYGYPEIPIGKVINGADSEDDSHNYAKSTWEYEINEKPAFKGTLSDYSAVPDATKLYRQILAREPDSSVTIISVGFSTNIARLLNTTADEYADLSGKELVTKKVKLLSIMAGSFEGDRVQEYNVVKDIEAARTVFAEWPTKIVTSPFELGIGITYPATSIRNDFKWAPIHPVVVAYESYLPMPYDRPTWDLTSVLYAVEGNEEYFTLSRPGSISVDGSGYTSFTADSAGQHQFLKVTTEQAARVKERLIELVSAKPKNMKSSQN
jgi:inosine-uridine nucleoside N-ribohydrolase